MESDTHPGGTPGWKDSWNSQCLFLEYHHDETGIRVPGTSDISVEVKRIHTGWLRIAV